MEACEPGLQSNYFRSRDGCRQWQAARDSFREREDIGLGIEVLGGKHLAGSSHPALHLIEDHQNFVFHGEGTKLIEKLLRRNQVPALALNRLENDSCNFLVGQSAGEDRIFDESNALDCAVVGSDSERAAIAVRRWRMMYAGHEGKILLWMYLLPVSDSAPMVRPWKDPKKAMNCW